MTLPIDLAGILPELWLSAVILLHLALDIKWKKTQESHFGAIAALGLFPLFPIILWQGTLGQAEVLGGMLQIDPLAAFFKMIFAAAAILVILMTRQLAHQLERSHGEFYLLILMATLGMMFTAGSANFLMLFVSIELISITFYILTAYLHRDKNSLESSMKYLILGSLSSGLFLYGTAFIYGATGSMQFSVITAAVKDLSRLPSGLAFGLLLTLAGIFFKVGAAPFHMWVPDVYQGAPTPVTAFLSVGSKAAGFVVALRILIGLFGHQVGQWSGLLAWVAGATILYGNLCAIPQKNIKRLLGYSSIGHAGYILIGLAAGSSMGYTALNLYLLSYLFTNLAAFLVVAAFSKHVGSDQMDDYAGLSRRSPLLAAMMFIALLSLAGVPPLSGFFAKFLLLMSVVSEGYLWLAIIGAAAVVISLYYYLSLVMTMYVEPPTDPSPIPVSRSVRVALYACAVAMLVIGLWQAPFLSISFTAVKSLF